MKKRIVSALLITVLLISMVSLVSCQSDDGYEFDNISMIASDSQLNDTMNLVFEDTTLEIGDDGDWKIYKTLLGFFKINIGEGTYTVENGVYTFTGFEYDLEATGKETDAGFEIYFADSADQSGAAVTLYYVK